MAPKSRRDLAPLPKPERRRRRFEYILILVVALVLAGGYYLERSLYQFSFEAQLPKNMMVFTLINVNLLLLLLLLFFLIRNIIKVVVERRSRIGWSRLRTRLVVGFAAFSLVPTILLFFFSTVVIKRSVESWFKGQVDNAMQSSVDVAESYYRQSQERALHFAQISAEVLQAEGLLEGADEKTVSLRIEELRRTFALYALELYGPDFDFRLGSVQGGAPVDISRFTFPFASHLLSDNPGQEPFLVDTFAGHDIARAYTPVVSSLDGQTIIGYIVADVALQDNLLQRMSEVASTYEEYWRLRQLQSPLKTSYIFTLIMVFAMVIMLATWVGMYLAKNISEPIQELASATDRVAKGDLDVRVDPAGDDEIGQVIDSFNAMTADLKTSKESLQDANRELRERNEQVEAAKRYIEIVLGSVAAGVISFDREGRVTMVNRVAAGLLGLDEREMSGQHFREIFQGDSLTLARELMSSLRSGTRTIQRQWVYRTNEGVRNLLVNLTAMEHGEGNELMGAVLVIEDLTELVDAQRAAAWREVARRIAHEIKNPLTPIQLSAQRLRKRYMKHFENDDVFDECTHVIIEQVDMMKALVNEFSQFARMPHARLAPHDLNDVVDEVETLYKQAHGNVLFHYDRDSELPLVNLDAEQIKRVVVNLLDNAVAAMGDDGGEITLQTRYNADLRVVKLEVRDTGTGIPVEDRQRIFEPYFTTKKGGTGLGLAIVRKIMEDHQGYIRVQSNSPQGAVFVLEFPAAEEVVKEIA